MKTTRKYYLKNGIPWTSHMHIMPDGIIYTYATHRDNSQPLYFLKDFINYAAIDQRDIYKIRKGDTFKITKSFRNGDIFQIDLESKRSKREKYFVLSEDLKNSFLTKITENS